MTGPSRGRGPAALRALALLAALAGLEARAEGLGLSGFLDVRAADRRSDPNVVSLGGVELDLARELGRNVQVGAAVVVNEDGASLAVAFVDVHLFGGSIAPRGRLPVEKGFHVQLGRFDVPFGNDWQLYAAKDRTEASAPLTTEELMDGGANDVGIRVLGTGASVNYSAYVLRGEGAGNAFGGRVGVTPFDNPYRLRPRTRVLEAGLSLFHDVDGDGATERAALALDAELRSGALRLRGEWVRIDVRPAADRPERLVRRGWHVTAAVEAGELAGIPLTPWLRYDTATGTPLPAAEPSGDADGGGRTERLSGGLHATLFEVLVLKLECRRVLAAPDEVRSAEGLGRRSFLAQAVVTF